MSCWWRELSVSASRYNSHHLQPLLNFQGMGEIPSLPNQCRSSSCKEPFRGEDPDNCILSRLATPSLSCGVKPQAWRLLQQQWLRLGLCKVVLFKVQLSSSHKSSDPDKRGQEVSMLYTAMLSWPCPHSAASQAARHSPLPRFQLAQPGAQDSAQSYWCETFLKLLLFEFCSPVLAFSPAEIEEELKVLQDVPSILSQCVEAELAGEAEKRGVQGADGGIRVISVGSSSMCLVFLACAEHEEQAHALPKTRAGEPQAAPETDV